MRIDGINLVNLGYHKLVGWQSFMALLGSIQKEQRNGRNMSKDIVNSKNSSLKQMELTT